MDKNPSGLVVAVDAINRMVAGTNGDRNRDIYAISSAALREWENQGEKEKKTLEDVIKDFQKKFDEDMGE